MLAAVIDIGSNSVRLVLYQYNGHHAQPVFNEKLACALGASLVHSPRLDEEAKALVRTTIARFKVIIDTYEPDYVTAFATAAMRESEDGGEFADELSVFLGYPIRIIDGLQEASYSALGVRSTSWKAEGLVADLGGGSLDIAHLNQAGQPTGICSVAKGTLGFADMFQRGGADEIIRHLDAKLTPLAPYHADTLYGVGGSFRALAHHHMVLHDYPLSVIHDYALYYPDIEQLEQTMRVLYEAGEVFAGVPFKRQPYVYPAIIVLKHLMHVGEIARVVFSSVGVREGALRAARRDKVPYDPLLAMIRAMPEATAQQDYALALTDWLLEVLPVNTTMRRLIIAFGLISELAVAVHPEHRASFAYERMLSTMCYGLTHQQQVLLALALYYRYSNTPKTGRDVELLNATQHDYAFALGQLADMAHYISAGHAALLKRYCVERNGSVMMVKPRGSSLVIVPPKVTKWCDGLGAIINDLSKHFK